MITAYILDDEQHAHVVLQTLLTRNFPDVRLVGESLHAATALKEIQELKPDILFLDIEMPKINGLEMITHVNTSDCAVIFVTAYDNYAIDAFSERARGYILKPVDKEQFIKTVSDVVKRVEIKKLVTKNDLTSERENETISVPTGDEKRLVRKSDVLYLKADGSYTSIVTKEETFLISKNLKVVVQQYGFEHFVKVNRSFVVNLKHVSSLGKGTGGYVKISDGEEISIGKTYKKEVRNILNSRGIRF